MQLSIVMVDDDPLVLSSLQNILANEPDITVVGTAQTGPEAVALVRNVSPDVVLMDLHLGGAGDGVEAIGSLRALLSPPAILAVTSFDSDFYLRGALDAGATGFLLKNDAVDLLATAIRMTHDGDPMISPAMTSQLIASYIAPATDPVCDEARRRVRDLSDREIQVARLIGAGRTYEEIAGELFVSPSTVKSTIRRAMDKVAADSGAQLAVLVAQARLDLLGHA
ncbi:response regulator transcription factor [Nesterenkonia massiliensis]|uniref:Response regulator transcription factor n=1 Tax=Nesterenkonia massiliensis TaxID=1232429 RepID=A0ABT2HSQ0_9MICC|nr:response regulator transcription factor [Nesterenkonia massiliensis]MCT1607711.1 response regulator transcription factor [Nesterenkonia massiliensis]